MVKTREYQTHRPVWCDQPVIWRPPLMTTEPALPAAAYVMGVLAVPESCGVNSSVPLGPAS